MELGNILFNHGEGGYPVPRGEGFEEQIHRLFSAYSPKCEDYHGKEFDSSTFMVWPYCWCDCECGFDQLDHEWSIKNRHSPACYQTRRKRANDEYRAMHGAISDGLDYASHRAFQNQASQTLCVELDIPWNNGIGSAIHCTCEHDRSYQRWREGHTHDLRCAAVLPSFLYKPEGFTLCWYKYPLRDAYTNQPCDLTRLTSIIDACIASLASDRGGPVPHLSAKAAVHAGEVN